MTGNQQVKIVHVYSPSFPEDSGDRQLASVCEASDGGVAATEIFRGISRAKKARSRLGSD